MGKEGAGEAGTDEEGLGDAGEEAAASSEVGEAEAIAGEAAGAGSAMGEVWEGEFALALCVGCSNLFTSLLVCSP